MITTVTLNPSIDKTVVVDSFIYGGTNRIVDTRIDAGGKGINLAVAFSQLGGKARCLGFNYDGGGEVILAALEKRGINNDFITLDGDIRINQKIYDRSKQVVTELNELGLPPNIDDLSILKKRVVRDSEGSGILVLCGSIPEGVPKTIYRELFEAVAHLSITTVLDAEGDLLREGLKAKPYLIKPNLFELETVLDEKITSPYEAAKAAKRLLDDGIKIVCVSLGSDGAVILDTDEAYYAPGLKVKVRGTTGAGDSMLAGLCLAHEEGLGLEDMLRYGIAASTASVMKEGTLLCTKEEFDGMLPKVRIKRLPA
ncbi:MAG: 1-phosphofructokinase [Clostridiales bacterium]|nr:1-phosphofructokinase [Clostridiales bacterium]